MACPSQGLGQKHAKRDDVSFLEGRVFRATGLSHEHWDRPQTRLAGSRSEAQPPGARMAVREKTVTRCIHRVKHYATSSGHLSSSTSGPEFSDAQSCYEGRPIDFNVARRSFMSSNSCLGSRGEGSKP